MIDKKIIFTICYWRALLLLWGIPIFFLSVGFFIKGWEMFDINKLENTRLFGSNKIFPIILYAVYLLILIRETFIIFKSKGIYMYIENNRLYCKNKFITLLSDIDTTKSYFITKYFAKFLHIDCILGSNVDITLVYAKLEDEDLLSKIIEL